MTMTRYSLLVSLLIPLAIAGCDSQELVQKRDKQEVEITRLRGELKLIEEKLKSLPPDRSKELSAARKQSEEQMAEIKALETEVAELEARKLELKNEFESYRAKYVVK